MTMTGLMDFESPLDCVCRSMANKDLFLRAFGVVRDHYIIPVRKSNFRKNLESIYQQKHVLFCLGEIPKHSILGTRRAMLFKSMVKGLDHESFPMTRLWHYRCRGGLHHHHPLPFTWSEVDKGTSFGCDACGENTESFFFRNIYFR